MPLISKHHKNEFVIIDLGEGNEHIPTEYDDRYKKWGRMLSEALTGATSLGSSGVFSRKKIVQFEKDGEWFKVSFEHLKLSKSFKKKDHLTAHDLEIVKKRIRMVKNKVIATGTQKIYELDTTWD